MKAILQGQHCKTEEGYSTEEQTIGKWINGKPLYRRIFTGTTGGLNELHYLGQISNLDAGVSVHGTIWHKDIQGVVGIPGPAADVGISGDGYIGIVPYSSSIVNGAITLIVEYTKSTD